MVFLRLQAYLDTENICRNILFLQVTGD